jgi:hypothetical protein
MRAILKHRSDFNGSVHLDTLVVRNGDGCQRRGRAHATVARLGSSTSNARGVVWFEFLHFGQEIESGSPSNIKLLLKNKAVASSPVAAVDAATEEAAALTAPAAPEARRPSSRELPNAGTVSALIDRSLYPSVPIYGDRPIQALTLRSIAIYRSE